jgi:hypothetical protein
MSARWWRWLPRQGDMSIAVVRHCEQCGEVGPTVPAKEYKEAPLWRCGARTFLESLSFARQDHYLAELEASMKARGQS